VKFKIDEGVTEHNPSPQWALITGASTGIGYGLAKLFATEGYNLALVARNEKKLKEVAAELATTYKISTKVLAFDLAKPDSPQKLFEALLETPISVLVNNAGFGWMGAFADGDPTNDMDMMQVNMRALVQLTHLFLKPMLKRKSGYVLNVASTAAFQPGPYMAMYYATKAFVFSFSVALTEELAGTGVSVTTLCPGFTKTEFQDRARMSRPPGLIPSMTAEAVARAGYHGMLRGKRIVIPGIVNKISSAIARRMPVVFISRIVRKINGK
jgi:short-subunit dehydrogenase